MNDYKLINSLLEDGSKSSMLKLKMIVNLDCLVGNYCNDDIDVDYPTIDFATVHDRAHIYIDSDNILKFVYTFKDFYSSKFLKYPNIISDFDKKNQIKILKIFEKIFLNYFESNPYIINYFDKNNQIKIRKMYKNIKFAEFEKIDNDYKFELI